MAEYIFEIGGALVNEETGEAVMKPIYKGKIVRCKDCKYRELETFHGKQRYVCQMDSADPYDMSKEADNDEWFCADGEEKQ